MVILMLHRFTRRLVDSGFNRPSPVVGIQGQAVERLDRLHRNYCGDRLALKFATLMPIGRSKLQISLLHGKNGGSTRFGGSGGRSAGFDGELVSIMRYLRQIRY